MTCLGNVQLGKCKIEMRNVCLNYSHNHKELSTAKDNLKGKSDQMKESSNYRSLNQLMSTEEFPVPLL